MLHADQLDAFAAAFTTLGRLQVQPSSAETMSQVVSLLDEWPISVDDDVTAAGIAALRASHASGEDEKDVRRDHDLLYGITARAKVPPFESVHRSVDGLVFDEETLVVREQYRRLGLQAPKLNREPDDHIGLELDFLAQCCVSALTALEQGADLAAERYVRIAADFTRDHLLAWAPEILARAEEEARTEWMRGLELLSRGAINAWRQALEEVA
ncbi:MAG: molecular chaperone TorD family protein [Ancrocorticia sp.]